MPVVANPKHDTREKILNKGYELVVTQGFQNTSLSELLKACDIPKGSFYYFFKNKDDFGLKLIDKVSEEMFTDLEKYFGNTKLSPLQRLRQRLYDGWQNLEANDYQGGCIFGSLAQEMAGQNTAFREKLSESFDQWLSRLTELLDEAQTVGEVPKNFEPSELAELFVNTLEGSLIRCKVLKNPKPIMIFTDYFFFKLCKMKPYP